jgi:hypothetical protein
MGLNGYEKEKDRHQDAGHGGGQQRRGHVDAQADEGARQSDHNRLERRREFRGEQAGRAQAVEEGVALAVGLRAGLT